MLSRFLVIVFLFVAVPCLAQSGMGNDCTPAGTWYGGSVVAYHMTIVPAVPAGRFTVVFEGMYRNAVLNSLYTGVIEKRDRLYEGALMQLTTDDPDFLKPPPIGKLPNLLVGWSSVEMVDCNTIRHTLPFLGLYFAANIWTPAFGGVSWNTPGKAPMIDPPDVDLVEILGGGRPIVEVYRRLPQTVNPMLLHKN